MPLSKNVDKFSEFTFTWQIENFILCLVDKKRTIESPKFRIEQLQDTEWYLELYLPGHRKDKVSLNLRRSDCDKGPPKIRIKGKLFIAKKNGSYIFLEKCDIDFELTSGYIDALTVTLKSILENSADFLPKDTLTVGYKFLIDTENVLSTVTECSARSMLCLKEYSFLFPLKMKVPEIFNNWGDYSIISPPIASISTEYPVFVIGLIHHFNDTERILSVEINISTPSINGFFQCKLSFFDEESIKYECKADYFFLKGVDFPLVVLNISKDTFNKYSIFSATYLKCELSASTGEFTSFLEKTVYTQKMRNDLISNCRCESYLQSNLGKMYSEKTLCDFKIIVSGREFSVHKTVLAAVSPVFRGMFESGMTETEKSQVTIEEFSVEAVEKMLEFSYSDRVQDLKWNVTLELYSIADYYDIQKLKKICSSFLESALGGETVPELLVLADLHKDNHLSEVAEKFICGNSKAVFRSDAWKQFMKNNLQVASETMLRICELYSEMNINPLK